MLVFLIDEFLMVKFMQPSDLTTEYLLHSLRLAVKKIAFVTEPYVHCSPLSHTTKGSQFLCSCVASQSLSCLEDVNLGNLDDNKTNRPTLCCLGQLSENARISK